MIINELINRYREDFIRLCKEHQVKYLFAFGSLVSDNFDFEKSDIDLQVEIEEQDPVSKGEKLLSFLDELEVFFKRKVDLLTHPDIKNPYLRQSVDSTKVLIYDASKEKVFI